MGRDRVERGVGEWAGGGLQQPDYCVCMCVCVEFMFVCVHVCL